MNELNGTWWIEACVCACERRWVLNYENVFEKDSHPYGMSDLAVVVAMWERIGEIIISK